MTATAARAPMYPETAGGLWLWILANGGLHRSRSYWSRRLSNAENRAAFRYLDRAGERGNDLDALAEEIDHAFPWYAIRTADDLWEWLQATR